MNVFWKNGYKGISVHFTFGSRPCWRSAYSKTLWQTSLGWFQICVFFYDQPAAFKDYCEVKK